MIVSKIRDEADARDCMTAGSAPPTAKAVQPAREEVAEKPDERNRKQIPPESQIAHDGGKKSKECEADRRQNVSCNYFFFFI